MSWDVVRLGEVISHRKGFITIDDEKPYKLCRVQLHRRGVLLREIIKGNQIKTKKQQICKGGDFLVAEMDAKVGGYGFIPAELDGAIVSSHYYLFELNTAKINPKYLEVLSKLPIIQDQIKATGSTNYAAIRPQNVLDWEIPLPDIQTQEKIADLYLKTSTGCDYLNSNYLLQLDLLKKLRQQILQDAVQGKLVPQDSNDEPANDLRERIKAEKEKLVRAKKIKKEKPLPPIKSDEIPFEIPENWVWCRIPDILFFSNDAIRRGPFGSSITKSMFIPKSSFATKIYEQKNAIYKDYALGDYYINLDQYPNLKSFLACAGDIIISCAGTIGETYLLPEDAPTGIINQALLKVRLNEDIMLNHYFMLFFQATLKSRVNVDAKGSAMKNLGSIGYLKEDLYIPLPPINEQNRILNKVRQLMTQCDELEQSIQKNQKYTQELLLVALKEALEPKNI